MSPVIQKGRGPRDGFGEPWSRYPVLRNALMAGVLAGAGFVLAHLGLISSHAESLFYSLAIPLGGYHWAREAVEALVREWVVGIGLLMLADGEKYACEVFSMLRGHGPTRCALRQRVQFRVIHMGDHRMTTRARGPSGHRLRVGLVALGLAMGLVACGNNPEEASSAKPAHPTAPSGLLRLTPEESSRIVLEVAPVARGQFRLQREFPATVQANRNELAEVTTLVRGRVVKVPVDFGQDVKKGTLLAMLHSTDLGVAEGDYLKADAKLYEAELAHTRAKELYENKVVSLAELLRREATMKTAWAEARETQGRLELLGVTRQEVERLNRERTIKADVPLRAPFDGRVIMRNITRGEIVETQQKLFTVADLSDVWVFANVPEKDVQFIQKDQIVEVVAAAYPHALFKGRLTYVGDVLDPTTRTMGLRVTVPNPDRLLKPEMFAIVLVYAEPDPETLTVPLAAVQKGPTGKMVFVQRGTNEFEIRTVKLGREYGEVVTVLEGVQAGEPVVTNGSFSLQSEMERHKLEPTP